MNLPPKRLRTLQAFRDVVVILGILLLCFLAMQDFASRVQARRDQEVRYAVVRNAIAQLDSQYKDRAAKIGNDQVALVYLQNQMLIEYEKLIVSTTFLPASAVRINQPANAPSKK
jgi:hypothetical protein